MNIGAGFGLVSLLVVVAIILFLLAGKGGGCTGQSYLSTVAQKKQESEAQANQWGGRDLQGRPLAETITLQNWPEQGAVRGLEVTAIDPTGAAASFYGLQVGDVILEIGPQEIGGPIIENASAGVDFLHDAYAKSFPIKVRRGGQELTLPDPNAPGGSAPSGNQGSALPGLPGGLAPGG